MTDSDFLLRLVLSLAAIGILAFVVDAICAIREHKRFPYYHAPRKIHNKRR